MSQQTVSENYDIQAARAAACLRDLIDAAQNSPRGIDRLINLVNEANGWDLWDKNGKDFVQECLEAVGDFVAAGHALDASKNEGKE